MLIPKTWANYPNVTNTPLNANALAGLERRVGNYVGADNIGPGVNGFNDFFVAQTGVASMAVLVGTAITQSIVIAVDAFGSTNRYESTQQVTISVAAADPSNPRIDRVLATAPAPNSDSQVPILSISQGTPTSGATLSNLNGAAAIPVGSVCLATVFVGAAATSVVTANIQDERPLSQYGVNSNATGALLDQVTLTPHPFVPGATSGLGASHGTNQYAALMFLPRRVLASRLRWRYAQGATALTGNYNLGIYSAAGRQIVTTGSVALAGAANTFQTRAEVITQTTFEAGAYIVWLGLNVAAGSIGFRGVSVGVSADTDTGPGAAGVGWINGSAAGVTAPVLFNANMADVWGQGSAFIMGTVPILTLASA